MFSVFIPFVISFDISFCLVGVSFLYLFSSLCVFLCVCSGFFRDVFICFKLCIYVCL